MIDSQAITFDKPALDFKTNLMPTHVGPSVNVVENFVDKELINGMERVKTPISILKEQLLKHGFLIEHNDAFEKTLQQLMNQGVV